MVKPGQGVRTSQQVSLQFLHLRYVYEHSERHGFPSEWIGITFSVTTFWNGILAIVAGIISNLTAESMGFGPVAPFVVALAPLVTLSYSYRAII